MIAQTLINRGERRSPLVDYLIHRQVDALVKARDLQPTPVGRPSRCRTPFRVVHPDTGLILWVPCKGCIPCRITRRDAWWLRLQLEAQDHRASSFLTLTYADREGRDFYAWDDAYLRDFQLYMKRLRWEASERGEPPIRFFRVTERGKNTRRYHHHLIAFGRACEVRGGLGGHHPDHAPWGLGFVEDEPATRKAMKYVAKYVTKSFVDAEEGQSLSSQSKGIGLARCYRMGLRLGEIMAKAGRPAVVPSRIPIGMEGWQIKRELDRGREPGLPLMDTARQEFARGVTDAGAELVPDVVPWLDPLVARAMDRAPERLERERIRERINSDTDARERGERERDRFNPRRL